MSTSLLKLIGKDIRLLDGNRYTVAGVHYAYERTYLLTDQYDQTILVDEESLKYMMLEEI